MAILILALTLAFAVSPLATDGFNGFTPDQFPVVNETWPIQPAGWAFSIWGLIYLALIGSTAFGVLRRREAPGWVAMRPWLAISLGVGVFWIAAAQASPPLATVMIVVMAAGAIAALLRAGPSDRLALGIPLGLYAGWLTAATGVAVGVMLSGYGILGAGTAAVVMLPVILAVTLAVMRARPDGLGYPLAVGWALLGITVENIGAGNGLVAAMAAGTILIVAGVGLWWSRG